MYAFISQGTLIHNALPVTGHRCIWRPSGKKRANFYELFKCNLPMNYSKNVSCIYFRGKAIALFGRKTMYAFI